MKNCPAELVISLTTFRATPGGALKEISTTLRSINLSASPDCFAQSRIPLMPEEIFDVVNDRDEVIGQKSRSEIHRLKLNHRAVHVLVFNARGELFLQVGQLLRVQQRVDLLNAGVVRR